MQIIADLDDARGIYCGAVGYLAPGQPGHAQFAVGIRTAHVDLASGQSVYGAGGGITWSSDPTEEWEELRHKCAILAAVDRPAGLLETMRVDPVCGPVNLDRHLSRLAGSADYFAIPFQAGPARQEIRAAVTGVHGDHRLRVELSAAGGLTVSLSPMPQPRWVRCVWLSGRSGWTAATSDSFTSGPIGSAKAHASDPTGRRRRGARQRARRGHRDHHRQPGRPSGRSVVHAAALVGCSPNRAGPV